MLKYLSFKLTRCGKCRTGNPQYATCCKQHVFLFYTLECNTVTQILYLLHGQAVTHKKYLSFRRNVWKICSGMPRDLCQRGVYVTGEIDKENEGVLVQVR